jgi:hypothetical protein
MHLHIDVDNIWHVGTLWRRVLLGVASSLPGEGNNLQWSAVMRVTSDASGLLAALEER